MTPIRVGIVGANPDRGWASAVHVPVIALLPGFTLKAVCTTRMESARRAAERFGADLAFDDPAEMVCHPDFDLLVISVKAPDHCRLATLAIDAGKHVYCEWPLAASHAEAEAMAGNAARRGVCALVGLQSRGSPVLRYLRDLLKQHYVGRVIAVRMHCALPGGGARRSQDGLYVIHRRNGASTLDIQGGHSLDAFRFCVGEFGEFVSLVSNQFPLIEVIETGEQCEKDAPDQLVLAGITAAGAALSVAVNGGAVAGHGIGMEIYGDKGTLAVRGNGGLNFQMNELQLWGAQSPERMLSPMDVPTSYDFGIVPPEKLGGQPYPGVDVPRATLVNVANLYLELEQAIREGRDPSPGFADGVRLHKLLTEVQAKSV